MKLITQLPTWLVMLIKKMSFFYQNNWFVNCSINIQSVTNSQGSFEWKPEELNKLIYCKKEIQYSDINPLNAELSPICHLLALLAAHHILHVSRVWVNLQCSPLLCSTQLPQRSARHKFLGTSLLVVVPASQALPPLPTRPNGSYVHVERLLGAKGGENCWVIKGLVNIANGVTPVVLSPESFSRYDGLWEVQTRARKQ